MEKAISLKQIGLYNPQRQSDEVTERLFVARQKQFELLLNKIVQEKENSIPQHYLVIGQRGMGKTTLLKRMEVQLRKPPYRQRFIPLLFPEEQYNIKDLAVFWSNCLDALADNLESEDKEKFHAIISDIDKTIRDLSKKASEIVSEEAYKYLLKTCNDLQRRPVLLVDNIGLVFKRLDNSKNNKQGQWALRKLLSENGAPIIISAGPAVTDDVINYAMPFYDFFQIQYLRKLSFEEFTELLENLADRTQINIDIIPELRKEKPRLQTLYHFTGGNPRTAVMLFKLLVKGFSADVADDLDALVDEVTPLYKAKLEELSPQQQIIIDAIAMNWHAIPFRKLASDTDLAINLLSSQLNRLLDDGWIEKVEADKKSREINEEVEGIIKGSAYFISERFFNTWFLMRRSNRRDKKGVHSLSEFLECLYGRERLEQETDRLLQSEITTSRQIMRGLSLAESAQLDPERKNKLKEKIYDAVLNLSEKEENVLEEFDIPKDFIVEKLHTFDIDRTIAFTVKFKPNDTEFWYDIGDSLLWNKQYEKAVICYSKSLEINPNNDNAWHNKGYALNKLQRFEEAIDCFNIAIELDSEYSAAWHNKGCALNDLQRFEEAVDCIDKAIELDPMNSIAWNNKGAVLNELQRFEEAVDCIDKAIELDPMNSIAWNNKGAVLNELQRYEEAIECCDKAIELNPEYSTAWGIKGYALIELKNYENAVYAYEEAKLNNPNDLLNKFHLTFLYRDKLDKKDKAIEVFNEIEQDIAKDENRKFVSRYYLNKTLFELHDKNQGSAREYLLQAFETLMKENRISSIANEYWWTRFGSVVIDLGYGSWLLAVLEEKGFNIVLSPYYTAIQALEIEKQDSKNGQKDAEIYLKNRAVEISEPARMIIERMRKYIY